jgi:hypothetical protein
MNVGRPGGGGITQRHRERRKSRKASIMAKPLELLFL